MESTLKYGLDGSPVATFVLNTDHKVIMWNKACEAITGIRADTVIGTNLQWQGFYDVDRPLLADFLLDGNIDAAIETYREGKCQRSALIDGAYEAEGFFPRAGKMGKWLFFTAALITDDNGTVSGVIETLQDISEKKQAEQLLLSQNESLESIVSERTHELEQRNKELMDLTLSRNDLENQVQCASSTAMTAMSSIGEMGVLLRALQGYNNCETFYAVTDALLDGLRHYDLVGSVELRVMGGIQKSTQAADGLIPPHDGAIFARLRDMGRVVRFHSRMIVNFDRISVIVHNLPVHDEEKTGRILDNLAVLVEAADVRLAALVAEIGKVDRQEAIVSASAEIKKILHDMETQQQHSLTASSLATHNLSESLEKLFVTLGLTQSQENMLLNVVTQGIEDIRDAQLGLLGFNDNLGVIIQKLQPFEPVAGHARDLYREVWEDYAKQTHSSSKDEVFH